ncbi:alpha/beta hydrolase [Actinomadura sp. ATCC 31491]|uniref:Alpha/beta hydrolase n=1 Tax=Actinomadura luzonensis TaxID=2805427 RepID=A0ABT0G7Q6_9ACTN|nr:alpha/beta hydrolase [Actinomadura luzonensis]MCK2220612.1 alpha/beta hydrolase [Actinomadura luzonensis]
MPGAAVVLSGTAVSADGTPIAYDRYGSGPAVVLVAGAMMERGHPTLAGLAQALAPWFTVYSYDRRGRGGSGDTAPYAVEREIEDLAAVVAAAGGSAKVFGGSSGAALALEAAGRLPGVRELALWEPPYHVDDSAPPLPDDFAAQLGALVAAGRRGEAVERFMVEAAEMPAATVAAMRAEPFWAEAEAVAHTLAYEAAVLGPGNALPAARLAAIDRPTLVLTGEDSPAWMRNAGAAVAAAVPGAAHRVLEDQTHGVAVEALAPELLEFFAQR